MLRLLNESRLLLDPLYGMMRRAPVPRVPRPIMLFEDQIFAARLALAGPFGHLDEVLSYRRSKPFPRLAVTARRLGVPPWQAKRGDDPPVPGAAGSGPRGAARVPVNVGRPTTRSLACSCAGSGSRRRTGAANSAGLVSHAVARPTRPRVGVAQGALSLPCGGATCVGAGDRARLPTPRSSAAPSASLKRGFNRAGTLIGDGTDEQGRNCGLSATNHYTRWPRRATVGPTGAGGRRRYRRVATTSCSRSTARRGRTRVRREMYMAGDRLLLTLLSSPSVRNLVVANPYRSAPIQWARRLAGQRPAPFPDDSRRCS